MQHAGERAELFRAVLAEGIFKREENPLRMTVSIGLAGFPVHGFASGDIYRAALDAFQSAQESGGNCVKVAAVKTSTD